MQYEYAALSDENCAHNVHHMIGLMSQYYMRLLFTVLL